MSGRKKAQKALRAATPSGFHPSAAESLAKWDAGESVWSVEMGGIGPGYEQCIQVLVFEIIRDGEPLPAFGTEYGQWGEKAVTRCDLGFSGAQVGAARGLAYRAMKFGWDDVFAKAPDRKILVSREWPRPPPNEPPAGPSGGTP